MLPPSVLDIIPLDTLHTNAQVEAVQELRADMEGNIHAAAVSDANTYGPRQQLSLHIPRHAEGEA